MDLYEKEVVVHVASYHADRAADYNERNLGLGLRLREPDSRLSWGAGFYRNSIRRDTLYAGAAYDVVSVGPATIRIMVGGVTGYTWPVTPIAVPELALRWGSVGAVVQYLPKINGVTDAVIGLSFFKAF